MYWDYSSSSKDSYMAGDRSALDPSNGWHSRPRDAPPLSTREDFFFFQLDAFLFFFILIPRVTTDI